MAYPRTEFRSPSSSQLGVTSVGVGGAVEGFSTPKREEDSDDDSSVQYSSLLSVDEGSSLEIVAAMVVREENVGASNPCREGEAASSRAVKDSSSKMSSKETSKSESDDANASCVRSM